MSIYSLVSDETKLTREIEETEVKGRVRFSMFFLSYSYIMDETQTLTLFPFWYWVRQEWIRKQQNDAITSYQDDIGYIRLKSEYENLKQKFVEQSKELGDTQARLETVTIERNSLKSELRTSQAECKSLRYTNEASSRQIASLEESITNTTTEYKKFQESVFEILGIEKTTITKTSIETLRILHKAHDDLVNDSAASEAYKEEIRKLNRLLDEERKKAPSISADATFAQMKEIYQLKSQLDSERSNYASLSRSIKIYREGCERECEQLVQQLETAHKEMKFVQENLRNMHELAARTINVSASTFAGISTAKEHKCKYSASIFETAIAESSTGLSTSTMLSPATESGRYGQV
jgi:chromosome segregation ATPase